jgi:hypothetical protein
MKRATPARAPLRAIAATVVIVLFGSTLASAAGPLGSVAGSASATKQAVRVAPPAAPRGTGTTLAGCPVFPADNPWNTDISAYPVRANSAAIMARYSATKVTVDFFSNTPYGFPITVVPEDQPLVPISYYAWPHESDPGPMPIPLDAAFEVNEDHHLLVVQQGTCKLYELGGVARTANGWTAGAGAIFDLRTNALRPEKWTSTDNAGLPVTAGLVRCEDMAAGRITHAIRMVARYVQNGYVSPARHGAGVTNDPNALAMGMRLRLKADYDISRFTGHARIIMEAFKTYGLIVADQGPDFYFHGERANCFNDAELWQIRNQVPASAFEVVDTGPVVPWP